jgi:hypothetical protein
MLFLLFFVVDATRLCITWIELLRRRGLNWTEADQEACMSRYNLPARHCLAWTLIHMIGERTNEVARLIYYPVLVILLLILSRSTFFDAWGLPQALAVVIGINILIALSAAVRLNLVAQAARADILDELRHEQLKLESEPAGDTQKPTPVEVRDLVDQLQKLRTGAYLGIWDRPVVRAFLLLLGAIGITFSEYFALM